MPANLTPQYQKAEEEYFKAQSVAEKFRALKNMLSLVPKHKGTEKLQKELKEKLAKLKSIQEKERKSKKSGYSLFIKREGAGQVVFVGTTNTGKSTLLKQLTNADVLIADYEFTTKKPEVGIVDYKGVKLQIIEIPAVTKDFENANLGPTLLSMIQFADLMVLFFNTAEEKKLLDAELKDIKIPRLIYNQQENLKDLIWKKLSLIKVYTKQPGKPKDFPPVALKKDAKVRHLASYVHKDFVKQFRFARIYGKSAKFEGQTVGLDHKLKDEDVVELHMK